MNLKELKEKIKKVDTSTYDYDQIYNDLYNACADYMNDSQEWFLDELFEDFVDYDMAEERARYELENSGLVRLYYFLGTANCNNNMFVIDGYGNLQDIDKEDLDQLKEDILHEIDNKLSEYNNN
jgi:hypothetical protein